MAEFLIIAVALFFVGMGVYGLAAPARLVAPFGLSADSPTSRAEVRAVYGGFGVAVAALLVFAAFDAYGIRSVASVTVAVALLGMAFGRIVSAVAEPADPLLPRVVLLRGRARPGGTSALRGSPGLVTRRPQPRSEHSGRQVIFAARLRSSGDRARAF
jgi:Domain of unknown function (DUF4345)